MKAILPILSLLTLASCITTPGYRAYPNFTPLKEMADCSDSLPQVALYFENEPFPEGYVQVGLVNIRMDLPAYQMKSPPNSSDILQFLRYEAWAHCANAVVNVQVSPEYVTGMAVRYPKDKLPEAERFSDDSFLAFMEAYRTRPKRIRGAVVFTILGLAGVVWLFFSELNL